MSTRDRIRPSDFHIHIRLPFDVRDYIVVIWELSIYAFVPRMTRPTRNIDTASRLLLNVAFENEVTKNTRFIVCQMKRDKKGTVEMLGAGTILAITALGRPRTNHFARPTMLSRNLELCISSKTNRIFACDHARFLYSLILYRRDTSSKEYSMLA